MKIDADVITVNGKEYAPRDSKAKIEVRVPKGDESNPFMEIGLVYFIRTVTHYFTGRLVWVGQQEIVIGEACWIADTGRFNEFMNDKNKANETEPFPEGSQVIVGRGSIIDMTEYKPSLILNVK